jgi:hypothetical protein
MATYEIVTNEHVWPEVEQVIERNDHYWIVAKIGHTTTTTTAPLDPLRASRQNTQDIGGQ